MTDGDDSTFTWFKPASNDTSVAGDYIQMDLGEAKEVYKVRIAMGAGSPDKWIKYILNIQKMETAGLQNLHRPEQPMAPILTLKI